MTKDTASVAPASTTARESNGQAVHRAFDILEAMLDAGGALGVSDIAAATLMPVGTVHRIVRTLARQGYARQLPDRRYCLGSRLVPLGDRAAELMGTRALPILRAIARDIGETVNLAVLSAGEAEYLAQAQGTHSMRMFTEVGHRVPLHATGVGKAMLATLPRGTVIQLLERGMPSFTDNTITTPKRMLAELEQIRSRGYAIDEGEMELGVRCVAVALPTTSLMAVSISGLSSRMSDAMIERCHERLAEAIEPLGAALQ